MSPQNGNWELEGLLHTIEVEEEERPSRREIVIVPSEPRGSSLSVEKIGDLMPPGVLGLQMHSGQPYNLVLKVKDGEEVQVRFLLRNGWFKSKKPGVYWAPASAFSFSALQESSCTYNSSAKVVRWLDSMDILPKVEFQSDCPLFDFQKEAVRFLVGRKRAMLSLSPGLGKTLVSAYAASLQGHQKVLLVAPASLLHYWRSELIKWSSHLPMPIQVDIIKRFDSEPFPPTVEEGFQHWTITNPETVVRDSSKLLINKSWDLLILDESILYKNRKSSRSKKMLSLAIVTDNCWALTGAPATRYVDDMWHQFHILDRRANGSYWRFAEKYCVVEENQWAKSVVGNMPYAEENIKKDFRDVYFARNQSEVADIPDWIFEDIPVPMLPEQEKIYAQMQEKMFVELGERPDQEILRASNHLSLVTRSIQIASNPILIGATNSSGKWASLPTLMEAYPGPYIIWVNFIRSGEVIRNLMEQYFPGKVALVNGSTSLEDRSTITNNFQLRKYDVLVMNNTVGKFGFTLTQARTAFFVEKGYDDSYFQCLHRFRRIGTTQSPVVVNLLSVFEDGRKTIDYAIHGITNYRTSMMQKLTFGDLRRILS